MKTLINFAVGAVVAAALVAPVAWADAQKIARTGMVAQEIVTLPVVWQSAVTVIRSVSLFTP